jgi:hypothetical protein
MDFYLLAIAHRGKLSLVRAAAARHGGIPMRSRPLGSHRGRFAARTAARGRLTFCAALVPVLGVACGSKTGLLVPIDQDSGVPVEAGPDTSIVDSSLPPEEDAAVAEEDALPPIDVHPPPPNDCLDAGATLIYVITQNNTLYSFYPPTATFSTVIGNIACPSTSTPFSMAVARNGVAYIVFYDGELFEVETQSATLPCVPTPFVMGQGGFAPRFGMGFSRDAVGTGETLYVASGSSGMTGGPPQLARIDTTTFQLTVIGNLTPSIDDAELTGTGAGDLFGFYSTGNGSSAIAQIDKGNAIVTGNAPLPGVDQGNGWAFAYWGGDFYTFTGPSTASGTIVTRYRPSDHSIVQVAAIGELVVGAGVSTCAP